MTACLLAGCGTAPSAPRTSKVLDGSRRDATSSTSASDAAILAAPPIESATAETAPAPPRTLRRVFTHDHRACALFSDGSAQCWGGFNLGGELGVGDTKPHETPTSVVGLLGAVDLTLGYYRTCAITNAAELLCWGRPLPDGASGRRHALTRPTKVEGIQNVRAVALGHDHACALDAEGSVWCWGAHEEGQLGVPGSTTTTTPSPVTGLPPIAELHADRNAVVALASDGRVFVWGRLGGPDSPWHYDAPHEVRGLTDVKQVVMSSRQVCALQHAATVRCFTYETLAAFEAGQQHDFGPEMRALAKALMKSGVGKRRPASPAPKTKKKTWVGGWIYPDGRGLSDVVDLVTFNQDSTAVTKTGEVFSWGNAERGTAGFPVDSKGYVGPTRIAGVGRAVSVVGDFQHRCVLDDAGTVWCFGQGAPGARDRKDPEVAARVAGLPKVTALEASTGCTYAIGDDATLYAIRSSPFDACGVAVPDDPLAGNPDPAASGPIVVPLLPP